MIFNRIISSEQYKNKYFNIYLNFYLPGNNLAISAHLLPSNLCYSNIISSSFEVQGSLLIEGSK